MSLAANELFSSADRDPALRAWPETIQPKDFAIGSGVLAALTAVARNKATGFYKLWTSPDTEITLITPSGTVSGGTWTITVDGEVTTALAYNADAATIKAALVVLGGVDPQDVVVSGGPLSTGAITLTWAGRFKNRAVTITGAFGSITGGGTGTVTHPTPGLGDQSGDYEIAGFIWPDAVTLDGTDNVIGNVMLAGLIHFDDIPIVSGYTSNQLKEALRNGGVRQKDFIIQGLTGF